MSRSSTLITLGLIIALSPFLGLPHSWLAVFLPLMGLFTLAIGYLMRRAQVAAPLEMSHAPAAHMHDAPSPIA